ncbi:hypothetical protein SOVF_180160 [Spinacia oleracea]|nr:hypothetical protein SOVF_180160 [Spinacia oleracea]
MPRLFERFFSYGFKQTPARVAVNGGSKFVDEQDGKSNSSKYFQMPLHYPRYKKDDYEKMVEWKLDCLLASYGLPITGTLEQKRKYAMGAFLWE